MKSGLTILVIILLLTSCGKAQYSVLDYENTKVKFAKTEFVSNNGEFSMLVPKGWFTGEDPLDSDTLLYSLESGPMDTTMTAMVVLKMKTISGNIENEFDYILNNYRTNFDNVLLLNKTEIKVGNTQAKAAHLTFEHGGKITQEEINIFIPVNETQYYSIGMVCDKNENIQDNFGMMLECAKSFKLKK